jgi:predicted dehydrogenase
MNQPFSIAILGAGMYGKVHIRCLQGDSRARVTWVCNRKLENAQQVAAEFGIANPSDDYRQALADPQVDGAVIAAPPYLHAEMLEEALQAGKHVLLEKPMVANRGEIGRVVAAVEAHPGQIVLEASCRHARLQPKFRFVKGLIDSGKLGRVYHIHHNHLMRTTFVEYNPAGTWGADKKLGAGGPFMDWGVYDLSFHLGLLGDVPQLRSLRSFTINGLHDIHRLAPVTDVEQHGAAWMEFDTGLTYYYERGAGVHCETACETRIYGEKGGLRLQFPTWDSNVIEFFYEEEGKPFKETITVDMSAHPPNDDIPLVGHFLDCLEGRDQPMMPVKLAAKHQEILFEILGE